MSNIGLCGPFIFQSIWWIFFFVFLIFSSCSNPTDKFRIGLAVFKIYVGKNGINLKSLYFPSFILLRFCSVDFCMHFWKRFELALVVSEIKCKKERTLTNTQNDNPFYVRFVCVPLNDWTKGTIAQFVYFLFGVWF